MMAAFIPSNINGAAWLGNPKKDYLCLFLSTGLMSAEKAARASFSETFGPADLASGIWAPSVLATILSVRDDLIFEAGECFLLCGINSFFLGGVQTFAHLNRSVRYTKRHSKITAIAYNVSRQYFIFFEFYQVDVAFLNKAIPK